MKALRGFVFNAFANDPVMNQLGLKEANLYQAGSRDSTPITIEGNVFAILRWGPREPARAGVGSSIPLELAFWVYHRDPNTDPIDDILKRGREVLALMIGAPLNPQRTGFLNGADYLGSTADLFDDVYQAWTRSDSHRIVASEI